MLGVALNIPTLAQRKRASGPAPTPPAEPPSVSHFPVGALAYWEGQGQSNMTGFNQISDAPTELRVINPALEMMTEEPGWRPYGLLATGESATFEGTTYDGKFDEADIPSAAGGAGPLIGLHEANIIGAMDGPAGFAPGGLLLAKFADAGKHLNEFLPDYDDGSAPLGGANFNARGVTLPGLMRDRIAADGPIYAQGKVWMHGEANAAGARAAGDLGHPDIANYAAGVSSIRAFDRSQFGLPSLPWFMVSVAEADQYDAAINDALASLCRWRVAPDGAVADLGAGRDATSYVIDHMISPVGDVHFNMTQMRAIGSLVFAAAIHAADHPTGLSIAHVMTSIQPVWQRIPALASIGSDQASIEAVANEDGVLHSLASPAGNATPDAATIAASDFSAAGLRGRTASVQITGLTEQTDYDIHCVYESLSGDFSVVRSVATTTDAATPVAGWSPATPGAVSWWDAQDLASVTIEGGEVSGWSDKSGGGVVLTPSGASARPVLNPVGLNGLPALDFDGDDDLEGVGAGLAPDMILLVVAEIDTVTNGSEAILEFKNSNLAIRAQNNAEFRARFELMNGVNTNISPSPIVDYKGAPHLFVSRYDSVADTVEIWIDGVLVASQATYSVDLDATDDVRLMRPFGTALRIDGKLGEVAAIASSSQDDRERLEGYAAHRWGLSGILPDGHPWKASAP